MDESEALLENVFAAVELGGRAALGSVALDEDVLHRIVTSVLEDLRERGELEPASDRYGPR